MRQRFTRAGLAGLLLALAAGCAKNAPQDTFDAEGDTAQKIDTLQRPVFIVAGIVGVLVAVAIVYLVVKFRDRPGHPDEAADPVQIHGNTRLEVMWTAIPFLILAPIAVVTVARVIDLSDRPDNALVVSVYGQQWWWSYEYELDGNEDNGPEIITANDLVIPEDREVVLELHSRDVIHSFWIPALAGTRDAVPGRMHTLVIEADHPGVFVGQCKEFCGLSHANMRARAVALTDGQFEAWLEQQQEDAREPTDEVAQAGLAVFETKCATCHQVNGVNEVEDPPLVAGHAPNLTHFMSRGVFASAMFPLYNEDGSLNRPALEAWLRDPPGVLPMAPEGARGMPNLALTEDEIDELVAYLSTLGPGPLAEED